MLKGIYDIFTIEFSIHGLESCIIISVSILIVTILLKKGLSISRNEPINQSNNIKPTQNSIESKESSYKPKSYFEISQQKVKKLQSIIYILIRIKAPCYYKVCNYCRVNPIFLQDASCPYPFFVIYFNSDIRLERRFL